MAPDHREADGAEGGLQVLAKDGSWLDVPHVPDPSSSISATDGRMDQRPLGLDLHRVVNRRVRRARRRGGSR